MTEHTPMDLEEHSLSALRSSLEEGEGNSPSCADTCANGALPVLKPTPCQTPDPKSDCWEVEVRVDGVPVITIGRDHLGGLSDIDQFGDRIRACAEHLRAFIGSGEPEPCFVCGGGGVEVVSAGNGNTLEVPCSLCEDAALGDGAGHCTASTPGNSGTDNPSPFARQKAQGDER